MRHSGLNGAPAGGKGGQEKVVLSYRGRCIRRSVGRGGVGWGGGVISRGRQPQLGYLDSDDKFTALLRKRAVTLKALQAPIPMVLAMYHSRQSRVDESKPSGDRVWGFRRFFDGKLRNFRLSSHASFFSGLVDA